MQQSRQKASARIDKLRELVREKEAESEALQARLSELTQSLTLFEQSFAQIAAATGLSDPDDIVNKFFLKEEVR